MQLATAVALQIGQSLDRIKAYEMLTTERNLLRALVDTLPDYVFAKDIHGRFVMSNAAHAAVLGVARPQDAVGKTDTDFFPRSLAQRYRRDDEAILRTGTPLINREEPVVNRSGLRQWVLTTKVPWRDLHGGTVGLVGVSRDITQRKRSEETLKLSEARLQSILDNASAIVYLKDLEGRYLLVNRKFEALTGLPREKTVGGTDLDLFPDALARTFRAHDAKVLSSLTAIEFEEEAPQSDGLHTFLSVKFPLLNSAGRAYAVCGMSTDISERKREEEKLRQAHAELRQSEASLKLTLKQLEETHAELKATELQLIHAAKLECIGTLAAGVAHEVKNPLQTLIMGLDYLTLHLPTQQEGVESVLGDMRYAVRRANAIVSSLLELSTTTTAHARPEDLNACVERSLDLLEYDLMTNQTVVLRHFDPGLPPVSFDRGQMEQVLLNLFINALHAMPRGGQLTVTTRPLPAEEVQAFPERISRPFHRGDSLVAVEVQDTGTGIAEAILPRIFDPFFTTKPVGQGTGLGLAVVRRIVDLHGGSIDIRNAVPKGVRATLILKADPPL